MENSKASFKLHVSLLQFKEGMTAQEAAWQAWLAGPSGLQKLLSTDESELPMEEPEKADEAKPAPKKTS